MNTTEMDHMEVYSDDASLAFLNFLNIFPYELSEAEQQFISQKEYIAEQVLTLFSRMQSVGLLTIDDTLDSFACHFTCGPLSTMRMVVFGHGHIDPTSYLIELHPVGKYSHTLAIFFNIQEDGTVSLNQIKKLELEEADLVSYN